jgi:hypothetical protein
VRDVCPNRTHERGKARQQGKSDVLDAERIARETLAHPLLPLAFKTSSAGAAGADVDHELLTLWHGARRSVLTSRQHLINEAEFLLDALPEELRRRLPDNQGGVAPPGGGGPARPPQSEPRRRHGRAPGLAAGAP